MHPARIAELLQPFLSLSTIPCHSESGQRPGEESAVLSPTQLQHISTYIDILLRWNARINLTAIRDPEEIVTRHFGESLFAASHLFPTPAPKSSSEKNYPVPPASGACPERSRRVVKTFDSVADLGSGAGFPGIPIKLWAPHLTLTLIESSHKKTAFLREIIRALTLTNINVFPGRAEQLLQEDARPSPTREQSATVQHSQSPARGLFDLVTFRAVERFTSVLPTAASLVRPGGRLALLIGSSQQAPAQATLPTFAWDPPVSIPESRSRTLLIAQRS